MSPDPVSPGRRRRFLPLLAIAAVAAGPAGARAEPLSIKDAAALFGARPNVSEARLSPSGRKVVYLSAGPGAATVVKVYDVETKTAKAIGYADGRPMQLSQCGFVTDSSVVCQMRAHTHYNDLLIGMGRTVAIDVDTGKSRSLGVAEGSDDVSINQFDGEIIDWLPASQGSLLMARNYVGTRSDQFGVGSVGSRAGLAVDRIKLAPFKVEHVEPITQDAGSYLTDGNGNVRLIAINQYAKDGNYSGKMSYRYRTAGSRAWLTLVEDTDDFEPLAIDGPANTLYYLKKLDGRKALYKMTLDGSKASSLVASNPSVDIDGIIPSFDHQRVVGYSFTDDRGRNVYFDPAAASLVERLAKALPKAPLLDMVGQSNDGDRTLIFASSDVDAGSYYLFNRKTHELNAFLLSREPLEQVALAPVKAVSIPTRDGKSIPAYLTMSADGPATGRPAVVLPHGGPSARDEWGFDWIAQFLAARGYAVIQPNFRGSAGYGDKFLGENAFKDWALAMHDIADSADWLGRSGIADPKRMAIVGWSYGGYAALQSATLDPRYKAVAAIAPVTDLGALRDDSDGFLDADIAKEFIGKGENLKTGSPLLHAAAIKSPVLLVHGDLDNNVRISHSQRMARALQKAGTPVDLLTFAGLDHQLDDSAARTQMLTRLGELLDRTIGH